MMFGSSPFAADTEMDLYNNIISGKIHFPSDVALEVKDIITSLCTVDQSMRMGRTKGGVNVVMQHLWLSGFPYESLMDKSMEAPYKSKVRIDNAFVGSFVFLLTTFNFHQSLF